MNGAVIVGSTVDTAYLFYFYFYFLNLNFSAIHLQGLNLGPAAYSFISFQVLKKKKKGYIVHWDFNFSAVNFNELLILRPPTNSYVNFGRNLPSALPTEKNCTPLRVRIKCLCLEFHLGIYTSEL